MSKIEEQEKLINEFQEQLDQKEEEYEDLLGNYNEFKIDTKLLSAQVSDYANQIKDRDNEIMQL